VRVLVVEESRRIAVGLRRGLLEQGYAVDLVRSGRDAVRRSRTATYAAIVLDLLLPDIDGFEVCRRVRAAHDGTPLLMLTARASVSDRVAGLDAGADDCLNKPFSFDELLARMRAIIGRDRGDGPEVLRVGDLSLDVGRHEVRRGGVHIRLTPKEFSLLEYLMLNRGQVLTRQQLLAHGWDFAYDGDSNVLDLYTSYLREKIDRPFGRASLETVRGVGYRLRDECREAHPDQERRLRQRRSLGQ
jgi:two-component system OmpR family response regulator